MKNGKPIMATNCIRRRDHETGLVIGHATTVVRSHESPVFEELIDGSKRVEGYADKAYDLRGESQDIPPHGTRPRLMR